MLFCRTNGQFISAYELHKFYLTPDPVKSRLGLSRVSINYQRPGSRKSLVVTLVLLRMKLYEGNSFCCMIRIARGPEKSDVVRERQ